MNRKDVNIEKNKEVRKLFRAVVDNGVKITSISNRTGVHRVTLSRFLNKDKNLNEINLKRLEDELEKFKGVL